MQEDAGGRHLLQPLAAGIPAALLVLAIVVVAVAERCQELLGESAHRGHQGLAEDGVPPQLQLGIWRAGMGSLGRCSCPKPQSPGPEPTTSPSRPTIWGQLAKNQSQPPKANPTTINSPKANQFTEKSQLSH